MGKPGPRTLLPVPSTLALVGCQEASLALNPLSSPNPPFLPSQVFLSRFHRKGLDTVLKKLPLDGTVAPEMPSTLWSLPSPSTFCRSKKAHGGPRVASHPLECYGKRCLHWGLPLCSKNVKIRTCKGSHPSLGACPQHS